jgi:hypothetical protein
VNDPNFSLRETYEFDGDGLRVQEVRSCKPNNTLHQLFRVPHLPTAQAQHHQRHPTLATKLTLKDDPETPLANLLPNLVMNADDVARAPRGRGSGCGLSVGHVVRGRDDVSGCHVSRD